jgi:hypothetical protein
MSIMNDGYATTISFGGVASGTDLTLLLKEKSFTPPPLDGDGVIDTTTFRNQTFRTKAAKSLKTLGEFSFTAAYDPDVYTEFKSQLNTNQQFVITFPNSETMTFYGIMTSFSPNQHTEGEQPDAEVTIVPSCVDASGVEQSSGFTMA